MIKHLGSSLVDVMYVFDEPSIGLHPRDVHRLNELLQKLRDKGNTVLVVEHDPDVIKMADHIVDVGPHAGSRGGTIVFEGTFPDLLHADTLTGRHMHQGLPLKDSFRKPTGKLAITNARVNNLQNINVDIPTGVLIWRSLMRSRHSAKSAAANASPYSPRFVLEPTLCVLACGAGKSG